MSENKSGLENRSVNNSGNVTGNITTGDVVNKSSKNSPGNNRYIVIATIVSGLIVAIGAIIAAIIQSW